MSTPFTQADAQKALAEIAARAQTDAEFRALALKDAGAAIKQITGQDVPSQFKLRFVDGTGYHATFVLPPAKGADGHLSEDDLDTVSGGTITNSMNVLVPCGDSSPNQYYPF